MLDEGKTELEIEEALSELVARQDAKKEVRILYMIQTCLSVVVWLSAQIFENNFFDHQQALERVLVKKRLERSQPGVGADAQPQIKISENDDEAGGDIGKPKVDELVLIPSCFFCLSYWPVCGQVHMVFDRQKWSATRKIPRKVAYTQIFSRSSLPDEAAFAGAT